MGIWNLNQHLQLLIRSMGTLWFTFVEKQRIYNPAVSCILKSFTTLFVYQAHQPCFCIVYHRQMANTDIFVGVLTVLQRLSKEKQSQPNDANNSTCRICVQKKCRLQVQYSNQTWFCLSSASKKLYRHSSSSSEIFM